MADTYPETLPVQQTEWDRLWTLVVLVVMGAFYSGCLFFVIWTAWCIV